MSRLRSFLLASAAGCGLLLAAGPVKADDGKVSGAVTVDGQPLAAGTIVFHLDGGQFVGCKVVDGKYVIDRVPVGTRKVTITGTGVPPKYGQDGTTPLTVEVKKGPATVDISVAK